MKRKAPPPPSGRGAGQSSLLQFFGNRTGKEDAPNAKRPCVGKDVNSSDGIERLESPPSNPELNDGKRAMEARAGRGRGARRSGRSGFVTRRPDGGRKEENGSSGTDTSPPLQSSTLPTVVDLTVETEDGGSDGTSSDVSANGSVESSSLETKEFSPLNSGNVSDTVTAKTSTDISANAAVEPSSLETEEPLSAKTEELPDAEVLSRLEEVEVLEKMNTNSVESETQRVPYYLANFKLIMNNVLADPEYEALFNKDDMDVMGRFLALSGETHF